MKEIYQKPLLKAMSKIYKDDCHKVISSNRMKSSTEVEKAGTPKWGKVISAVYVCMLANLNDCLLMDLRLYNSLQISLNMALKNYNKTT